MGGKIEFSWMTHGTAGLPVGTIWIRCPPGWALFCSIAQRNVWRDPSSAVLLTRNVSAPAVSGAYTITLKSSVGIRIRLLLADCRTNLRRARQRVNQSNTYFRGQCEQWVACLPH